MPYLPGNATEILPSSTLITNGLNWNTIEPNPIEDMEIVADHFRNNIGLTYRYRGVPRVGIPINKLKNEHYYIAKITSGNEKVTVPVKFLDKGTFGMRYLMIGCEEQKDVDDSINFISRINTENVYDTTAPWTYDPFTTTRANEIQWETPRAAAIPIVTYTRATTATTDVTTTGTTMQPIQENPVDGTANTAGRIEHIINQAINRIR